MPNPRLSSLTLPVKDATTQEISDVTFDLPASGSSITVDDEISSTSENPVQNKVISAALDNKANISSLGTAATRDVPSSGNANVTQVVIGSDTRLTNARNAADVHDWAKAETKPTYTASEVGTYTTSEIDNMFSTLETNIDWKEAVDTYNDIATTYPNPVDGWTVNVKDTDYTYRYSGSEWVAISANAIPEATTSVNGLMTTIQVTKLNGIATGAEVNQNAFSNVKVGTTTVAADSKTDTLELVAGSNVTLTPDATNDKVTIAATDSTYPNAVKNITRSGTTFTATRYDDTTFTFDQQDNNTVPSAYCSTAAGTAAKTATCTDYALLSKSYIQVIIKTANTSATALTLNINGKGAKPIYINGSASSTSNYTLPAGSYLVYYNGTNYYFRTDGKLTASITGDAATVNGKTVAVNVPSGAVFTDTRDFKLGTTRSGASNNTLYFVYTT